MPADRGDSPYGERELLEEQLVKRIRGTAQEVKEQKAAQQIRGSGREVEAPRTAYELAMKRYSEAVTEYSLFILEGKIPPWFKGPDEPAG